MPYTFDLSKTKDIEAAVTAGFTFAIGYLSGVSVHASLLAAVLAGGSVIGYTGVTPKTA